MKYGVELLEETYGNHINWPAPKDRDTLESYLVGGFPSYKKDPTEKGRVLLDSKWVEENLVLEWFPLIGQRFVNRLMVVPLFRALSRIAASPHFDYIKSRQCGIFVPRFKSWNPRRTLSFHALALAIDINWNENAYGTHGTIRRKENKWIITVFKEEGFNWGGDWSTPDDMHFCWVDERKVSIPRP